MPARCRHVASLSCGRDGGADASQVYLTWIPLVYIFNTNLLEILLGLFPRPPFRNLALRCLTEIGALPEVGDEHKPKFTLLFQHFMASLTQVLPENMDIAKVRTQLGRGRVSS